MVLGHCRQRVGRASFLYPGQRRSHAGDPRLALGSGGQRESPESVGASRLCPEGLPRRQPDRLPNETVTRRDAGQLGMPNDATQLLFRRAQASPQLISDFHTHAPILIFYSASLSSLRTNASFINARFLLLYYPFDSLSVFSPEPAPRF